MQHLHSAFHRKLPGRNSDYGSMQYFHRQLLSFIDFPHHTAPNSAPDHRFLIFIYQVYYKIIHKSTQKFTCNAASHKLPKYRNPWVWLRMSQFFLSSTLFASFYRHFQNCQDFYRSWRFITDILPINSERLQPIAKLQSFFGINY